MRHTSDDPHSSDEQPDNPLVRLFDEDDETSESIAVETSERIPTDDFCARLESLAKAADAITRIQQDVGMLRKTGLREEDVRDLIYGRNASVRKRDIEAVLDGIDDVRRGPDDLLVKLLADVSGLSQTDTREVLNELDDLRSRYGEGEQ